MNSYELVFITNPDLEEERMTAILDRIRSLIASANGNVDSVDDWGMRKLAYSIRKMSEGRYTLINFQSAPSLIGALEKQMKLIQEVMRFVVVKKGD